MANPGGRGRARGPDPWAPYTLHLRPETTRRAQPWRGGRGRVDASLTPHLLCFPREREPCCSQKERQDLLSPARATEVRGRRALVHVPSPDRRCGVAIVSEAMPGGTDY